MVTSSRHLSLVSGLADDDLDKIAEKTNGDRDHAARVAADILDRADKTVDRPYAYILRSLASEPERYRCNRPMSRAEECPTHIGKPARGCPGCAADAKAVDR